MAHTQPPGEVPEESAPPEGGAGKHQDPEMSEAEEDEQGLEDDLNACMCSEEEDDDDGGGVQEHLAALTPGRVLGLIGEDLTMRIVMMLAATHLCNFSQSCKWARQVSGRDVIWKSLFFERWSDPQSHKLERSAVRDGWKKVYAARDIDSRRQDEDESPQTEEDAECQEAFRAMHAARRSLSLNRRADTFKETTSMDEILSAIREFKSHVNFPYAEAEEGGAGGRGDGGGRRGDGGTATGGRNGLFGKDGFYTTYTTGPLMTLLRPKLNGLPRQSQMEVCVCKLTGNIHICSRDGSSVGCDLVTPNDDGFFVCPVTGIIWSESRHHEVEGEEDIEGACEPDSYEGGDKSHCNLVSQGYDSEKEPSVAMGWGTWLEDRMTSCARRGGGRC